MTDKTVWVGIYDHKHGRDVSVFATEADALQWRINLADEWWENEFGSEADKPDDKQIMANIYWDKLADMGEEFLDIAPYPVETRS